MILLISILCQALIICFLAWRVCNSSWPAFILFIIYLGGLIVLFIYIVRLASNEKIFSQINFNQLIIFIVFSSLSIFIVKLNIIDLRFLKTNFSINFYLIFTAHSYGLVVYRIVHLLIRLIVIIKICIKFLGPLKSLAY